MWQTLRRMFIEWISYVVLTLTGLLCWPLVYLANTTTVIGKKRILQRGNVLIISNHLSMIDSWPLGLAYCWPWTIWHPGLLPWHVPEFRNFYLGRPLLALFFDLSRCIPIKRNRGDFGSGDFARRLPRLADALQHGTVMIFPEGGRNKNDPTSGLLHDFKPGAAVLAHRTRATIVPMAIRGMEAVLPVGRYWPRFGQRIVVVIGEPFTPNDLYDHDRKAVGDELSSLMASRLQTALDEASAIYNKNQSKT